MPRACTGAPTPPCLPAAPSRRPPARGSMAASTSAGSGPSRRWVCSRRGRKARQAMAMSVERPGAWTRFMAEARARMAEGVPLESRGTVTRLTGLVLEAVGLRVPVGAQCLVGMPGQAPVLAEVVGFSGERTFLIPAGDTHGLCSGARVLPCAPDMPGPVWGEPPRPIRRTGVLRLPMGNGLLGRGGGGGGGFAGGPGGAGAGRGLGADGARPDQRDGARPGAPAAGHGRARDQRLAHG